MQLYGTWAKLSVGEVKSSSRNYTKGRRQLEEQLALLEWAVRYLRTGIVMFTKVGVIHAA
jgi:hypothetical protein